MRSRSDESLFSVVFEGKAVGVNDRYISRRFVLNPAYRTFKETIAYLARSQNPTVKNLAFPISVDWFFRINKARDFDSLFKPLADGLELSGLIANDKWIRGSGTYTVVDKEKGEDDLIVLVGYRGINEH